MKKLNYSNLLSISLLLLFAQSCFPPPPQGKTQCLKVRDGDSVDLVLEGNQEECRILYIDAPEYSQEYGPEAAENLRKLILFEWLDYKVKGEDRFGRKLVELQWRGQSLDSLILTKGWAWYYAPKDEKPSLKKYQDIAQKEKRGLWACTEPIAPWDFRKKERKEANLQKGEISKGHSGPKP